MKNIFIFGIISILCLASQGCSSSNLDALPIETSISRAYNITVPFSPQSPFANWDDPYQEACEEMSLIMVHHFLDGTELTREQADEELLALVKWEEEHGYSQDVTLDELAEIAQEYYGYRTNILYNEDVTIESLKRLLAKGSPIIVPAAGRDLGNPYFSGEGPWYHMLVITGYQPWFFITNDPGTKRGEDYKYEYEVLLNAIHDWTGIKENIRDGRKSVLIVTRS